MTLVTLYVSPEVFWQGDPGPEIAEGCEGTAGVVVTLIDREVPFPQELDGVTETLPEEVPEVIVMLFVPCPAVTDQPEGTVQA